MILLLVTISRIFHGFLHSEQKLHPKEAKQFDSILSANSVLSFDRSIVWNGNIFFKHIDFFMHVYIYIYVHFLSSKLIIKK